MSTSKPASGVGVDCHIGVVGAGLMGSGIAEVSLPWAKVTVQDIAPEALQRCEQVVRSALDARVATDDLDSAQRDEALRNLKLTTRLDALSDCDIVIEAVFEDLALKRQVLADLECVVTAATVIASNTSALPISQIAASAQRPERVVGMHYFSPVSKMRLLELVVPARAAPRAADVARRTAVRQGKTIVFVRDRPGFFTTRVLAPFLNEAALLIRDGAGIEAIDAAACAFGFPVGPLTLLDALGIDVAANVLRDLRGLFVHPGPVGGEGFAALNEAGFTGRKSGSGFYRYGATKVKGRRPVNLAAYALLNQRESKTLPEAEIATRLALSMVNEAARCLHEDVVSTPRDGDLGAMLGLGFPRARGGPFRYVDKQGAPKIVETLERLRDTHGLRFEPAPLLQDMAREGQCFYPEDA